jgi:hypothetical protein
MRCNGIIAAAVALRRIGDDILDCGDQSGDSEL